MTAADAGDHDLPTTNLSSDVDEAFLKFRARHDAGLGFPEDAVAISRDQVIAEIQQAVWKHAGRPRQWPTNAQSLHHERRST